MERKGIIGSLVAWAKGQNVSPGQLGKSFLGVMDKIISDRVLMEIWREGLRWRWRLGFYFLLPTHWDGVYLLSVRVFLLKGKKATNSDNNLECKLKIKRPLSPAPTPITAHRGNHSS